MDKKTTMSESDGDVLAFSFLDWAFTFCFHGGHFKEQKRIHIRHRDS